MLSVDQLDDFDSTVESNIKLPYVDARGENRINTGPILGTLKLASSRLKDEKKNDLYL